MEYIVTDSRSLLNHPHKPCTPVDILIHLHTTWPDFPCVIILNICPCLVSADSYIPPDHSHPVEQSSKRHTSPLSSRFYFFTCHTLRLTVTSSVTQVWMTLKSLHVFCKSLSRCFHEIHTFWQSQPVTQFLQFLLSHPVALGSHI